MIFELDMMPVAVQSLVSPHPICQPSEQRPGISRERVQREAIADSTDGNLEFSRRVNNKKQQLVVALRPRTKVKVPTTAINSSSHPACSVIESGIPSDGRTWTRAKLVAG